MGISGCFGSSNLEYPIDDANEAAAAVEEIVVTDDGEEPTAPGPNLAMAQLVEQYVRRVRLLTWAVVAIAAVLIIKEIK